MIIVLGAVCVCLALALVAVTRILTAAHATAQHEWAQERGELLERIQRPERVPVRVRDEPLELAEREPDEWNLVGQIHVNDDYGLGDD